MRTVIVILFVSFVLAVNLRSAESRRMTFEEIKEALQPVKKHCIERVGTDIKLIDNANKGKFVPDRKLQCYYKCMLLNTKAMKDDKIIEQAFKNNVKLLLLEQFVEPVTKAIDHCRPIAMKPLEGCELAYELAKCYYEYDPSLVFYP
ncbi:uncharacterized protein [Linepithema humile]|uniref:uncharacterized protein n=1 Tax=Linepithema humile TaxID=83485 RepID=UPI0006230C2E|nr:PREDICTED: general odorant-binding protein lush [Linepithema humile]